MWSVVIDGLVAAVKLGAGKLHSGDETGQGKVRTKMIRGAGMEFRRGMWTEAWVQGVGARKFVALAVLGELSIQLAIEWFDVRSSVVFTYVGSFVSTLLWACLAYAVHARILLPNDRSSTMTGARVFGFALRSFGITIVVGTAFVLGVFILANLIGVWPLVAVLLAVILLGFPLFVWLATLLPAYVAGRTGGVNAAIERGQAQFGWIFGRLLIGPYLLFVLSYALYSLLPLPNYANVQFWNEEWVFLPVNLLGFLLFIMVQAFVITLTAVILSRAFLRAEGMPDTAAA
ncbi:MAG: hypothetical protein AAFW74_02775 [Pseudomonadota bacterium]